MAKLQARGAAWLSDRLAEADGRTITYSRVGVSDVSLTTATVEQQVYEQTGEEGLLTAVRGFDWFVDADELGLSPRPGDQIAATINGTAVVFEVLDLDDRPCAEWADTNGILLRIHTKRVG